MVAITNAKAAMMTEQALVCAAKYRLLALSESNQLMARLFEENALWLEGAAARFKRAGKLFKLYVSLESHIPSLCFRQCRWAARKIPYEVVRIGFLPICKYRHKARRLR
jgi:hypothetical protein